MSKLLHPPTRYPQTRLNQRGTGSSSDGSSFDVVFSDVVMPGMGGIALAEQLKRRFPDMPVVLASGYSHVLAADANHGFELLHKPYSADQLGRILSRIVQEHARRSSTAD